MLEGYIRGIVLHKNFIFVGNFFFLRARGTPKSVTVFSTINKKSLFTLKNDYTFGHFLEKRAHPKKSPVSTQFILKITITPKIELFLKKVFSLQKKNPNFKLHSLEKKNQNVVISLSVKFIFLVYKQSFRGCIFSYTCTVPNYS